MRLLFWILGLPLLLLAAFFAVANRESVAISLWPFAEPIQAQLWMVVAAPFYLGFLLGALVAWASGHGTRARARALVRRAETLQRDNANLQAQLDSIEGRTVTTAPGVENRTTEQAGTAPPAFLP